MPCYRLPCIFGLTVLVNCTESFNTCTTQFSVTVKTKRLLTLTKSTSNRLSVVLVYGISVLIGKTNRKRTKLCWRPRQSRQKETKILVGTVSINCKQALTMETWIILILIEKNRPTNRWVVFLLALQSVQSYEPEQLHFVSLTGGNNKLTFNEDNLFMYRDVHLFLANSFFRKVNS